MPVKKKYGKIDPDFLNIGRNPRIGVLVNPLSGGNRNGLGAVRNTLAEYPQVVQSDVQTPQEVLNALLQFASEEVDLVAVNGGDGTVQAALTVMFHNRPFKMLPPLVVLQSGTTSMTARDVGICGPRIRSLKKLFNWAATGTGDARVITRPVLQVEAPGHPTRYGMFFGTSAIYQGIRYFHRNLNTKGLRGEIGPGVTMFRFLWSAVRQDSDFLPPVPVAVAIDDNPPQQFDSFVILISTLERLFLGIYPYWGCESGPLHYTAVRAHPRHILRALPPLLRGRRGFHGTPKNGFHSHNAHKIELNFVSGFTLDGQLYTPENQQEPTVVRYGGTATFLGIS